MRGGEETMARGKRTDPKKRELVKSIIYLNPEMDAGDVAKAAELPRTTVNDIKSEMSTEEIPEDIVRYRQAKKLELIKDCMDIAKSYTGHLAEPTVIARASARDSAIVAGTMIDKAQLLAGEPTQITERQEPTPDLVKELDQKVKRLKELTGT